MESRQDTPTNYLERPPALFPASVEITLIRVDNGWIVHAGCAKLVFTDSGSADGDMYSRSPMLRRALQEFVDHPKETWEKWAAQIAEDRARNTPG